MTTEASVRWNPRLWMLISPSLPVGGYSYSQGLEYAVQAGWVSTGDDARGWILDLAERQLPVLDLAYLLRLHAARSAAGEAEFARWNSELLAWRETAELRAEDLAMGGSLVRLLRGLDQLPGDFQLPTRLTFPAGFALAGYAFGESAASTCAALAWVWLENQVAAAVKLIPLGQTEGQRILLDAADRLDDLVARALACADDELGATAPGLAIASAAHEMQYSRLFRS